MNKIDKNEELDQYYFVYHPLLKEDKQNIYELYYYEDYSINEIAEIYHVSKNAIFNNLKTIENQLYQYEKKMHLIAKKQYLNDLLSAYNINVDQLMEGYDE